MNPRDDNDDWIVLHPVQSNWGVPDVLATLMHELIHHITGPAHDRHHARRMGCFSVDPGW